MTRTTWACALVAVFAGGIAAAATPASAPAPVLGKFVRYETGNLTLFTTRGEAEARDIVSKLAKFHAALGKVLGAAEEDTATPTFIFIVGEQDWTRYLQLHEDILGWYKRTPFANYLAINGDEEGPRSGALNIVLHEYTHYLLRSRFGTDYPPWFNEGLAETMAYASFPPTSEVVLEIPMMRQVEAIMSEWIPFERLLKLDTESPEHTHRDLGDGFYAQSWLTVHYGLYGNAEFGAKMFEYLSQFNELGQTPEATRNAFGTDLDAIDRRLHEYSRSTTLQRARIAIDEVAPMTLGTGSVVPAADALAEIAALLLDARMDPARVEPLVAALETREPTTVRAPLLRARAAMRSGNDIAFRNNVEMAEARLMPDDWQARRELGLVWLEHSDTGVTDHDIGADARAELERALRWFGEALAGNPKDLEASWGYGTAATILKTNLALAETRLIAAHAQRPTSSDLALALANLYGRTSRPEQMIPYLEELIRYDNQLSTRKWAMETLDEAEQYLEKVRKQRAKQAERSGTSKKKFRGWW